MCRLGVGSKVEHGAGRDERWGKVRSSDRLELQAPDPPGEMDTGTARLGLPSSHRTSCAPHAQSLSPGSPPLAPNRDRGRRGDGTGAAVPQCGIIIGAVDPDPAAGAGQAAVAVDPEPPRTSLSAAAAASPPPPPASSAARSSSAGRSAARASGMSGREPVAGWPGK